MPETFNPYGDQPELAAAYESGREAGSADPEAPVPPLAPELVDAWIAGREAGASAALEGPVGGFGAPLSTDVGEDVIVDEVVEQGAHVAFNAVVKAAIVATEVESAVAFIAVQILNMSGRVPEPLPGTWSGAGAEPDVVFFAACSRIDHTPGETGVQATGAWGSWGQSTFAEAEADRERHGHAEAVVARYSKVDNTCGVVTAA